MGNNWWKPIKLVKNRTPISHLFFADYLILFAEASMEQAEVVKACLEAFCSASGEKVNATKSKVFFSHNVNHLRAGEIANTLGFSLSSDLGKYLGLPLHHKRVSKQTYHFILEKVSKKMCSWKASSLSLAGRITLSKSVLAAIPQYYFQTTKLPTSICDNVEKVCRDFIWGDTEEKRKVHLVAWRDLCKPRMAGGLGMRNLKLCNQAFLMKIAWGMVHNPEALWVQVLKTKYDCGPLKLPEVKHKPGGSNLWQGIYSS